VIALKDERRTMREGYAFLDEKCLLLAAAMLREMRRFEALRAELGERQGKALRALQAAASRHGLHGLQCYPAADASLQAVRTARKSLLGVTLLEARLEREARRPEPAVNPSPEAESCRAAFGELLPRLVEMAALAGNLERMYREYRRTVRRVRRCRTCCFRGRRDAERGRNPLEELEQTRRLRRSRSWSARSPGRSA
jgi:V/A-type H+-transporting ATPase subunit D